MNCENNRGVIDSELRGNLLSSRNLETLEEFARAQCEHLTYEITSISSIFQEDSTIAGRYRNWRQHWLIQTGEGSQFCYPIPKEEYGIYESGLVPEWKMVDCYMFHGKYYQVYIDGELRNEHFENSPNCELSIYKLAIKQIKELGEIAVDAGMKLRKGLVE